MPDMSGWFPADQASRDTLLYLQKWQRRDMYFYGGFALFFTCLLGWNVWQAVQGNWWNWISAAIYLVVIGLYVWMTRRAFHRWRVCEEILKPDPNLD